MLYCVCSCPVLIVTPVAARGLDLPTLQLVVNYNLPPDIDSYVHQIGRLRARRHRHQRGQDGDGGGGAAEYALTLVTERAHPRVLVALQGVLEECQQNVPQWLQERVTQVKVEAASRPSRARPRRAGRYGWSGRDDWRVPSEPEGYDGW